MGIDKRSENRRLARVVEERAGVGTTEIVSGWQAMLVNFLSRMKPFMRPGVTVTFQHLTPSEMTLFERLSNEVTASPNLQPRFISHPVSGNKCWVKSRSSATNPDIPTPV
jgi:hypothetical protein